MNSSKENLQKTRILIIGSGVIGKFNALELSQHGYEVTIADPFEKSNASNAALGILMGKIYQKRKGRSWLLREKSLKYWPKWINILEKYNPELQIEKPLIKLTTNEKCFEKLRQFALNNRKDNLEIIDLDSKILKNINNFFHGNQLQGIISHEDGRVNPKVLLNSLDLCLTENNIQIINKEIVQIKKIKDKWISTSNLGEELTTEIVILCNSLEALKFIKNDHIKLRPVLGQAIEIQSSDKKINFLSLPKHFNIDGKNFIPTEKNKIIIGSTNEFSTEPKKQYVDELIQFMAYTPSWLSEGKICKKWFGIRAMPEGEPSPILKSLDKGLILCSGFYKNGILLAPACSDWITKEIQKHI